jgi:predicted DCC family thiol-disulfide oxidoreductase YuxK
MTATHGGTPTLIFDGDCSFCTSSARWIERRLPDGVEVVAWQFVDDLDALGLSLDEVNDKAWWITADGRRRGGHLAIAEALIAAGGFWKVLGRISLVPPIRWVSAAVYAVVSRYRHRMPGGTPACRVDSRP